MGQDCFVAKRGTFRRRSGNHLGTTFIREHLEPKLREGKRHQSSLFAFLANVLLPQYAVESAVANRFTLGGAHVPSTGESDDVGLCMSCPE